MHRAVPQHFGSAFHGQLPHLHTQISSRCANVSPFPSPSLILFPNFCPFCATSLYRCLPASVPFLPRSVSYLDYKLRKSTQRICSEHLKQIYFLFFLTLLPWKHLFVPFFVNQALLVKQTRYTPLKGKLGLISREAKLYAT